MGDVEAEALAFVESSVKYHPFHEEVLTLRLESGGGTVVGGQFGWGGLLQKSNGGVQRFLQCG